MHFKLLVILLLVQHYAWGYHIDDYCQSSCEVSKTIVCKRRFQFCKPDKLACRWDSTHDLEQSDREEILEKHNKLRNDIASGNEKRGNMGESSDMNALQYSMELEFSAQCTCNTCKAEYDQCKTTPKYTPIGQNIYKSKNPDENIMDVIQKWYNEIELYAGGENFTYKQEYEHFTQIAWSRTTVIGCGKTVFKNKYFMLCCNYATAGNIENRELYRAGKACSNCAAAGTCNSTRYKSLCGLEGFTDEDFESPFELGVIMPNLPSRSRACEIFSVDLFYCVGFTLINFIM